MPSIYADLQDAFVEESKRTCSGHVVCLEAEYVMMPRPSLVEGSKRACSECVVCLEAKAVLAVMPCGHQCVCEGCATVQMTQCPMCRQPVEDFKRIYMC